MLAQESVKLYVLLDDKVFIRTGICPVVQPDLLQAQRIITGTIFPKISGQCYMDSMAEDLILLLHLSSNMMNRLDEQQQQNLGTVERYVIACTVLETFAQVLEDMLGLLALSGKSQLSHPA